MEVGRITDSDPPERNPPMSSVERSVTEFATTPAVLRSGTLCSVLLFSEFGHLVQCGRQWGGHWGNPHLVREGLRTSCNQKADGITWVDFGLKES